MATFPPGCASTYRKALQERRFSIQEKRLSMISNNTLEPISEKREEDGVVPTYTAWDKEERNGVVFRVPRRVSLQPEHLPRTTGNGKT